MVRLFEPGTDNVKSGRYIEVGPRGGKVSNPHHATMKNNTSTLPPTSQGTHNKWKKVN